MICKHCGSQLSIEDEKCRFCGQPNEEASQHIKDMQRYSKEFVLAKGRIAAVTSFVRSFLIYIIIIAALAIANIVILLMMENVYKRADNIILEETKTNLSTYQELCQEAYNNEDYYTLEQLYNEHCLYRFDEFNEYKAITMISHDYKEIYAGAMNLILYDLVIGYSTKDDLLKRIGDKVYDIYDQQKNYHKEYYEQQTTEQGRGYADQTVKKMELFLETYLKLTKEDITSLSEETPLQISVMIGRRLGIYE